MKLVSKWKHIKCGVFENEHGDRIGNGVYRLVGEVPQQIYDHYPPLRRCYRIMQNRRRALMMWVEQRQGYLQ